MNKYKKNKLYTVVFLLFGIFFIVYDLMLANVEFGFYCWIILTLIEIIVMIGCFIFCLYGIAQYYFELHEIKEFQKQKAMILKDIENIENEKKQYYEVIYNKQKDILYNYQNQNDIDHTIEQLNQVISTTNAHFCDHEIIDTILSYKAQMMNEKKIDFQCDIYVPSIMKIKDIDLSTILFNLLDNAIEACDHVTFQKFIFLSIEYRYHVLKIILRNSYNSKYHKGIQIGHGFGLKIIKGIVRDYDGEINISRKNEVFKAEICMYGDQE